MDIKTIPNTNKRYSITKEGIVFSNYRYNKNGEKIFKKTEVSKYLNNNKNKTSVVNLQFGKHSLNNKPKVMYMSTLMEKCFSLKPPDKHHLYDLGFKDGNCFNLSLKNIEYRIRTNIEYKFYPQPIYDPKGKITHKRCGVCGVTKEINFFHLQKPEGRAKHKTYRNYCEPCRSKQRWAYVNSDIERLKKYRIKTENWAKSSDGIKYFKKYRKHKSKYDHENITPHYIATTLRMKQNDLTPEIISLCRKKILLRRSIKTK